ncbi:MAG: flagellar basal body-associated protein FliL [Pseudomonadota bacterium]|nr:flagellar basal body-associated protein FliL [Pseudomonadota bacterium]
MAQNEVTEDDAEESAPLKTKPKRFIKLLLLVVLLVVIAGGGWYGWKVYSSRNSKSKTGQARINNVAPVFLKLDMFTVNLGDTDSDRYLQVEINLQLSDQSVKDKIKTIMPEVRNTLLLLLSSQKSSDIRTAAGKQQLANQIRLNINKLLMSSPGTGVQNVFFTSFIIQ